MSRSVRCNDKSEWLESSRCPWNRRLPWNNREFEFNACEGRDRRHWYIISHSNYWYKSDERVCAKTSARELQRLLSRTTLSRDRRQCSVFTSNANSLSSSHFLSAPANRSQLRGWTTKSLLYRSARAALLSIHPRRAAATPATHWQPSYWFDFVCRARAQEVSIVASNASLRTRKSLKILLVNEKIRLNVR